MLAKIIQVFVSIFVKVKKPENSLSTLFINPESQHFNSFLLTDRANWERCQTDDSHESL